MDSKHRKFNRVFFHSAESMKELLNNSVQVAISFPPFLHRTNARHLDKAALLSMLTAVHRELFRVLAPRGYLVSVNTDVRDRAKYNNNGNASGSTIWWKHQSIREICEQIGFHCVGTKIWVKTLKQSLYRYAYSYVVFYSKEARSLSSQSKPFPPEFRPDVWLLKGGTTYRLPDGRLFRDCLHPVLAERCIRQLSEPGEVVLAPFAGVGTIAEVARNLDRAWIGYEVNRSLKTAIKMRFGEAAVQ